MRDFIVCCVVLVVVSTTLAQDKKPAKNEELLAVLAQLAKDEDHLAVFLKNAEAFAKDKRPDEARAFMALAETGYKKRLDDERFKHPGYGGSGMHKVFEKLGDVRVLLGDRNQAVLHYRTADSCLKASASVLAYERRMSSDELYKRLGADTERIKKKLEKVADK